MYNIVAVELISNTKNILLPILLKNSTAITVF